MRNFFNTVFAVFIKNRQGETKKMEIAFFGAGSTVFAKNVLADCMLVNGCLNFIDINT